MEDNKFAKLVEKFPLVANMSLVYHHGFISMKVLEEEVAKKVSTSKAKIEKLMLKCIKESSVYAIMTGYDICNMVKPSLLKTEVFFDSTFPIFETSRGNSILITGKDTETVFDLYKCLLEAGYLGRIKTVTPEIILNVILEVAKWSQSEYDKGRITFMSETEEDTFESLSCDYDDTTGELYFDKIHKVTGLIQRTPSGKFITLKK